MGGWAFRDGGVLGWLGSRGRDAGVVGVKEVVDSRAWWGSRGSGVSGVWG